MILTGNNKQMFTDVALEYDIRISEFRPDIEIAGSPERSELRTVIEDTDKRLYVLECVFDEDVVKKKNIASYLTFLSEKNIPEINPYLSTEARDSLAFSQDRFWMVSPYIKGVQLNRPDYVFEKWRGKTLADFLATLKENSGELLRQNRDQPFSIVDYIYKLISDINANDPQVIPDIKPFIDFLERDFMDHHDKLPLSFCHGDYHPVNIIWGDTAINAVIDWEFSGVKPEVYDLANLIGCLGMENPDCLGGELVCDLISTLCLSEYMAPVSWKNLVPFIVAIRFAWLSEWLRRRDTEMIELETMYMKILTENVERLEEVWCV